MSSLKQRLDTLHAPERRWTHRSPAWPGGPTALAGPIPALCRGGVGPAVSLSHHCGCSALPLHLPRSLWWKRGDPRGQEGAPGVTALSCGWQEGGNKHLHGGNFKITPAPVGKSHCCWCWEPAPAVAAAPSPRAHPVSPPSTCSAPSMGSLASHPCQSLSCPLSCWGSEGMPKHWDQPTLRAGFGHESGSEANRPAHPPLGQRESRRGGSCLFV